MWNGLYIHEQYSGPSNSAFLRAEMDELLRTMQEGDDVDAWRDAIFSYCAE